MRFVKSASFAEMRFLPFDGNTTAVPVGVYSIPNVLLLYLASDSAFKGR